MGAQFCVDGWANKRGVGESTREATVLGCGAWDGDRGFLWPTHFRIFGIHGF
jgi:hypothetical protein